MNVSPRKVKESLFEQYARIGKVLASAQRLEILDLLAQGEKAVETIAQHAQLSVANASRHLQVLKSARLVEVRKDGKYSYYKLADKSVYHFGRALRELAELRLPEVSQIIAEYFTTSDAFNAVDRAQLMDMAQRGEVLVLDVRPADEYAAGHIPGAVSIPLDELRQRLDSLPQGVRIVAYCRGPYCVLASVALEVLRSSGRDASRLAFGLPEWRESGLPIETTPSTNVGVQEITI